MMKRKQQGPPTGEFPYNKRSKLNEHDANDDIPIAVQSKIDPTYGQRGAFPGLDDLGGEDDLFYAPASDGLEYLRMVRIEAKTVPNLLVAPSSPTSQPKDENLYQDYPRGYYSDGAYTALPLASSTNHSTNINVQDNPLDPQEAYYASLLSRFLDLSTTLQHPPPALSTTPPSPNSCRSSQWRALILASPPKPARLASLPQEHVIHGLEVLESLLTLGNLHGEKGRNIGAWAWGLLGRCREVGEMGSEEVGVVRGVGKRAGWLLRRMAAGEGSWGMDGPPEVEEETGTEGEVRVWNAEEEDRIAEKDGSADGSADGVETHTSVDVRESNALAEARERVIATLDSTGPIKSDLMDKATEEQPEAGIEPQVDVAARGSAKAKAKENDLHSVHATLDMIVTIIGECYGQRDLLDGRLLWDEIEWMTD